MMKISEMANFHFFQQEAADLSLFGLELVMS